MWPFKPKQKSVSIYDLMIDAEDSAAVMLGMSEGIPVNVQPRLAYYLSERSSDLGNAVNMISSSLSGIKRGLKTGDNDVVYEHPLLDLLNAPGEGYSGSQIFKEISESFLLTQEAWLVARGNINREPISLTYIRPYDVNVVFDGSDGLPQYITTMSNRDRRTYYRDGSGPAMRFIDKLKLNEIFPIIGSVSVVDDWRGRSPLVKLFYDLKMSTDGKRHNVSLINNGLRTTGILSPKPMTEGGTSQKWSADSVTNLEKKLRAFHQGAGNAGNVLILSSPADLQAMSQNNRDMDFMALLQNSKESIYNMYRIPLPMVLSNAMTLDNYTTANRVYYTKAVFPIFDSICDGIMNTLGDRYGFDGNTKMTFNDASIRDLQSVMVENMRILKDTEVLAVNEIRAIGGFEGVEGGDEVLVSSNKIPLISVSTPISFSDTEPPDMTDEPIIDETVPDEQDDTSTESAPV